MRFAVLLSLVVLPFDLPAPQSTVWSVESGTDPMTDGKKVSLTGAASTSTRTYELKLICARTPNKKFSGRFTTAVFRDGEGTPIPWEAIGSRFMRTIKFRIDSGTAGSGYLIQDNYSNEGLLGLALDAADEANFAKRLPMRRLLIGEIFPGEVVEFDFSTLTAEDRKAVEAVCMPGSGG